MAIYKKQVETGLKSAEHTSLSKNVKFSTSVPGEDVEIHQIHPVFRVEDEVEPGVLYG